MSEELKNFLVSRKTNLNNFSHVFNIGNIAGKVIINSDDLENFYNLCRQHLFNPLFQISIIERPTEKPSLFIDLDFISETEMPQYTQNDIRTIINTYNTELAELHFNDAKMESFILELNQSLNLPIVRSSGTIYKNGIHVIYPKIKLTHDEMRNLHTKVKTMLTNAGHSFLAQAIDNCVISGMYLYGFGKLDRPQYTLTKIYSHDLNQIDLNVHEANNNFRKYLSIRS